MNDLKNLRNKSFCIIGLGYIGSNLYDLLKKNQNKYGFELTGIDKSNLQLIENTEYDYVINCAGNSGDFRKDIINTIESNVNLIVYLLKHLNVRHKLLVLSSTRIYGFSKDKKAIFNEDFAPIHKHLDIDFVYDGTKCLVESILMNYSKNLSYKISIVRLSNVYGRFNSLDDSTLIKKIIRSKNQNLTLVINQNRSSTKDYIFIDDAIDGIMRALLLSNKNDVFNIASGISLSLQEISKILDLKIIFENEEKKEIHSNISIEKAKKELGFNPNPPFKKLS